MLPRCHLSGSTVLAAAVSHLGAPVDTCESDVVGGYRDGSSCGVALVSDYYRWIAEPPEWAGRYWLGEAAQGAGHGTCSAAC